jgi:acetate kinase
MPDTRPILVANLGSTSFKFRLYEMPSERLLAKGGFERLGSDRAAWKITIGDGPEKSGQGDIRTHEDAIRLTDRELGGLAHLAAVGFKPVMARGISGTQLMDARVLAAMEDIAALLPAHNPPYIAGVRLFNKLYPGLPCIGTFETAFYDRVPEHNRRFPIPLEWEKKYGIARHGFHGASHRYVSERAAELRGSEKMRLVSCHLGGSSSMAAVKDGIALDSSWGMTPQSGLPQNNRAGDFDCFAMIYLARECGLGWDAVEKALATESGLKGMSGLDTGDMRDLREAAGAGHDDARTAIAVFVAAIRKYLGQFFLELNGLDVLVFTAGIGENNPDLRAEICADLDCLGLKLDPAANAACRATEAVISTPDSLVEVRVIPTNEEIIIARHAWRLLQQQPQQQAA